MGWSSMIPQSPQLLFASNSIFGRRWGFPSSPNVWTDGIHGGGYVDAWMDYIFFCWVGLGWIPSVIQIGHNPKIYNQKLSTFHSIPKLHCSHEFFSDATNWWKKDIQMNRDSSNGPSFVKGYSFKPAICVWLCFCVEIGDGGLSKHPWK